MESILTSIKKLLGISEDDTSFDPDIIMHINSVFMVLRQLGIGPPEGFAIEGEDAVWADYMSDNALIESVKTYMYMKVRLIFDPPTSAAMIDSMNRLIDEFEWRLNVAAESNT